MTNQNGVGVLKYGASPIYMSLPALSIVVTGEQKQLQKLLNDGTKYLLETVD